MLARLRARTRVAAVAIAATLCTMVFASCLTAAQLPAQNKACCAAMHDCDSTSLKSSCCVLPAGPEHAVVPAKLTTEHALVGVIAPTVPRAIEPATIHWRRSVAGSVAPGPPGVPTYLFVSSFRI